MTMCKKCGTNYEHGSGGWAGLCQSCIKKLAAESKPREPTAIIPPTTALEDEKRDRAILDETPLQSWRRRHVR